MTQTNVAAPASPHYRIHGDNIVECERSLALIADAFDIDPLDAIGPSNSAVAPRFVLPTTDGDIIFDLMPGYGRWTSDILSLVRQRGGLLREAADTVITRYDPSTHSEEPVLAIEYCSALPAGNQAWQRSGRAYSFPRASVPLVYITEVGGFELNQDRDRKAARLPNPSIPFSYISYSLTAPAPLVAIYTANPGADSSSLEDFTDLLSHTNVKGIIAQSLFARPLRPAVEAADRQVLSLVKAIAAGKRPGQTLTCAQWDAAFNAIRSGRPLVSFLESIPRIRWSKTAYLEGITARMKAVMDAASQHAWGLTSNSIPICFFPIDSRRRFAQEISRLFPSLQPQFLAWLNEPHPLVVCWIAGFKPRGDDARPDRGLPPFARMLVGDQAHLLTVVYGPAKPAMWRMLDQAPNQLIAQNGLWEAILLLSNAVLVDSATDDGITQKGYLQGHWGSYQTASAPQSPAAADVPIATGEHDVDTVLHLFLSRICKPHIFEGMCNPPGGDWSGISLQDANGEVEYRWLSLPRVSRTGSKRPDHVVQVFGLHDKPITLSIESKDRYARLETGIGPRLTTYITDLVATPPNCSRRVGQAWSYYSDVYMPHDALYASAAAFEGTSNDLVAASRTADCDLIFALHFLRGGTQAEVLVRGITPIGRELAAFFIRHATPLINVRSS
jgi:hypothetical protein